MVSFYYTAFQSNYLTLGQIESDRLPIAERSNATFSVRTSLCVLNLEDFEKIKQIPFTIGPKDPKIGSAGHTINNNGFI